MKRVLLHNPGISSMNLGDKIIAESAKEEISNIIKKTFTVEISTHLPKSFYYMRHFKNFDYKFVLGSNLLKSTFFGMKRQWDITWRLSKLNGPCILIGTGWWQYGNKPNLYTKILLKSTLSSKYMHSVRDEYTYEILKSIGITNVINTSCPTMWKLTKEHCEKIKSSKSDSVIFTLTDYNKDRDNDIKLIEVLIKNYNNIHYWPQGLTDYEYLISLEVGKERINVLEPSLDSFNEILTKGNIDYVGTRLHGGIRALQNKVRTIIISIDNRAREKSRSFNLPIIERDDIDDLDILINTSFNTKIKIPIDSIREWKDQFVNY